MHNLLSTICTKRSIYLCLFLIIACITTAAQGGDSQTNYAGWEEDSEYNEYYNYKERDSLKGEVVKFKKITPLAGMAPGTAFIFAEGDDKFLVHLCPWDYANPKETGIRKDVKTKIKGSWAYINGEDVFLAAKVKQGDSFEFKVRLTKDGKAFWNMNPEELAKEKASK